MGFIGTIMGLAWIHDHWKLVVGIIVAIIVIRAMIRSSRRNSAIKAQQLAAQQAREAQERSEEEASIRVEEKLKRLREETAGQAPDAPDGYTLAYSYPDVEFYCPDDMKDAARTVQPNRQLRLVEETDNPYDSKAVKIYMRDTPIGYMYKNRLRDMVYDFAADDDRDFCAMSTSWTDKPKISLYFYRASASAHDDSDDQDADY